MASLDRIVDRLPSLYRPAPDEDGLLLRALRAVAAEIEGAAGSASHVMRAHWFDHADRARFDPHFLAARGEREAAAAEAPGEPAEPASELLDHPYVRDLARLGSLLGTPPWQRPLRLQETVEAYRQRLRRTVALHRNGLGTAGALRRAVEGLLPVDLTAAPELRDPPFAVEEQPAIALRSEPAATLGAPDGVLGPLMRFPRENRGVRPAPPTVYVTGVAEEKGRTAATVGPAVELYRPGTDLPGVGLAFDGTLGAGEVLRLRPAFSSWVGIDAGDRRSGVRRATSRPGDETPADPTAPGPWAIEEDGPELPVRALLQTRDRALWAAAGAGNAAGELWRHDGAAWRRVAEVPEPRCLGEHGHHLLVGTAEGLLRVRLFPAPPEDEPDADPAFEPEPVPGLVSLGVHALAAAGDGSWWAGTDRGLARVHRPDADAEVAELPLRAAGGAPLPVLALATEAGVLHAGTPLGLLQHAPGAGRWYVYAGGGATEGEADWVALPAAPDGGATLPPEEELFLPAVLAVLRGPDGSLWLGTGRGLARYRARAVQGLAFETVLEAFPDLAAGPVPGLAADERGALWSCTDRGLLRFDGRDVWQRRAAGWRSLGAADRLFDVPEGRPRGTWRFVRGEDAWQRLDERGAWRDEAPPFRTTDQRPTLALAWTDGVEADRGTFAGERFEREAAVAAGELRVRVKPSEERIVDGGLPALPRLPPGESTWRYLALEAAPEAPEEPAEEPTEEPAEEPADGPRWTPEGRRLPAGSAERPAAWPGRFGIVPPPLAGSFDEAVFPYPPAARVAFEWRESRPLAALVRIGPPGGGEEPGPETEVVERLWQGIERVRPAGVRVALAAGENFLRGVDDGNPE